jgi:hypothetical protein
LIQISHETPLKQIQKTHEKIHHKSNQTIYKGNEKTVKYLEIVDKQKFGRVPFFYEKTYIIMGSCYAGYNNLPLIG